MQTERPDDATGDSVSLARVHTFLAALLSLLGFGALPTASIADMLDELTGWLEMAKAIRRDPQGVVTRFWRDVYVVLVSDPELSMRNAAKNADIAAIEFGKRFLPVNAEDDRDTLNTADFDAMREELDKQTQIAAELRSERDTLLLANSLHASEVEELRSAVDAWQTEALTCGQILVGIRKALELKAPHMMPFVNIPWAEFGKKAVAAINTCIIPLPKPERVEPGQRWAFVVTAGDETHRPNWRPRRSFKNGKLARVSHVDESLITVDTVISGEPKRAFVTHSDFATAIYLGTEAT